MAEPGTIDVAALIEHQRLTPFIIRLVVLSWIITFFDGFDINVISFVAPYLATAYKIDRASMGILFSAGLVGTMVGGFAFGLLGDWIGRRPTIIAATAAFGVLTLGFALASNYTEFLIIRLIDGLAIGGMLPLCWALNIEYVPKRYQATVHSTAGLFYPSVYRGNGAGWATSIAKIGSIAGPILGGLILSTALPVRQIFVCLALCPALMAICMWTISRIRVGRRDPAPVRARVA